MVHASTAKPIGSVKLSNIEPPPHVGIPLGQPPRSGASHLRDVRRLAYIPLMPEGGEGTKFVEMLNIVGLFQNLS